MQSQAPRAMSDAVASLEDHILGAAVDPQRWDTALAGIEIYLGAAGSRLCTVDHRTGGLDYSRATGGFRFDGAVAELGPTSAPVRHVQRHPHWRRFVDQDFISPREVARDDFYQACFTAGIGYRLALRLIDAPDTSKTLIFSWHPDQGPVGPDIVARMARIEERLRLAVQITERLGAAPDRRADLLEALEIDAKAGLTATAQGRVLGANAPAAAVLTAGAGLRLRKGHLEAEDPASRAPLAAALAGPGGHVAIRRGGMHHPLLLTVWPLPEAQTLFGPVRTHRLVLIADPEATVAPAGHILEQVFGLTRAEAAILGLFAAGTSLGDIADRRGVTSSTLRGQFKSAMAKLGVERQAELMRFLANLPTSSPHTPFGG